MKPLISNYLLSLLFIVSAPAANSQVLTNLTPYSQFRIVNGLIFISGQIGVSPITGKLVDSSFDMEVAEAMKHIKQILQISHVDFSAIVNVTVYLKEIKQYDSFNKVYMKYFKPPFPARSCLAVKDIPNGAHIEIAAIAQIKN